ASDLVGVPNNAQAGDGAHLNPGAFGPYDRLKLITRVNFGQNVAARKYGDWSNDERIWDPSKGYLDSAGVNFCELDPGMNGEKGTRYRFTVQVEDNTPFWYKNEG